MSAALDLAATVWLWLQIVLLAVPLGAVACLALIACAAFVSDTWRRARRRP